MDLETKDKKRMEYQVRRANTGDMDVILAIYESARRFMAQSGNPGQWGTSHPARELLEEDIRKGQLYVLCNGSRIHGVFAFILGEDPTYREILDGAWSRNVPYGTIHRIAGDGSGGILHGAVRYCEKVMNCLRIDTHRDNHPMQRAILKEGFRRCGIIYLPDGSPRIAYDR